MPQRKLNSNNLKIDPVTGFTFNTDPRSKVSPALKSLFLTKLSELADVEEACKACNFNRRILTTHLEADSLFRLRFSSILAEIKDPEHAAKEKKRAVIQDLWTKLNRQ